MKRLILPITFLFIFAASSGSIYGQKAESSSQEFSDGISRTVEVEGIEKGKTCPELSSFTLEQAHVSRVLDQSAGTLTVYVSGNGLSNEIIRKCVSKAVPTELGIRLKEEKTSVE